MSFSIACSDLNEKQIENNQHSVEKWYSIGIELLNKDSENPIYDSAEIYLLRAADAKLPAALYTLGYEYTLGHKLERKRDLGLKMLRNAADYGVKEAHYVIAEIHYRSGEIEKSKSWLKKGVESGDDYSAYELYKLLFNGYAFGKLEEKRPELIDLDKGLSYLIRAAEMGNFDAQISLSYLYSKGKDNYLKPDINKAYNYFEMAKNNENQHEIPGSSDDLESLNNHLHIMDTILPPTDFSKGNAD